MHLNENICTIAFKGSFKIFFPHLLVNINRVFIMFGFLKPLDNFCACSILYILA